MTTNQSLWALLPSDSFLEHAFLRWILTPAISSKGIDFIHPQHVISVDGRAYRIDYAIIGKEQRIAIELDGFAFHAAKEAFNYDRLRQNDLVASGWTIVRYSYDSIRTETFRCVNQLQRVLTGDSLLRLYLIPHPVIEQPCMDPDPICGLSSSPKTQLLMANSYFETTRPRINMRTLRDCQVEAFQSLSNYYGRNETNAACVMSVGSGKTALGVVASLAFTRQRALIITPGSVIRGTFHKALDYTTAGNVLYGLPGGPLIPGCKPPQVLTLDRDDGPIRGVSRQTLLEADIIITNFHSLGNGEDADDLLAKLYPDDIDFIVVDEAHIAAAESYQRAFRHFARARTLLMSACFQRLDGRPIDADVVYRYRLIDSIADGNAKNLRVHRFAPQAHETTYEMIWPDGRREEIVGREALLAILNDERKLARITAKSDTSIRQVMRIVKAALDAQVQLLAPIKPRVLFSALGERHAVQIARIAEEYGIPCDHLHHSMPESRIRAIRSRFEEDSGDLQGIVQLKMLGQGYDFPPITVVVPMRPYGSFGEFYQFIGRGIRVLQHPALFERVKPSDQALDIVYHAELSLDDHIATIYRENDMDPAIGSIPVVEYDENSSRLNDDLPGSIGRDIAEHPEAFVLFERGQIEQRIVHDEIRVEQRRREREREALAHKYAAYAQSTSSPISFEQFVQVMRMISE